MNQWPPFRPSSHPPSAEAATDLTWASTEPSGPGDDVLKQILLEMKQSRKLLEQIVASTSKQAVVVEVTESQDGECAALSQDVQVKILSELESVHKLLENVTDGGNAMYVQSIE